LRIVVDMQGCQTNTSRNRGIGRYSLALAQGMARNAGDHEIWLALNGELKDAIEPIQAAFDGLIPRERMRVFDVSNRVAGLRVPRRWRRPLNEHRREAFLRQLKPDFVHISSPFEGQDAVLSIERSQPRAGHAVTLYDLIPLQYPDIHLKARASRDLYMRRLEAAKRADVLLAISEASRQDALAALDMSPERIVNISSAVDPSFRPVRLSEDEEAKVRARYGILRPFVMYTGGLDPRKNIEGLIAAYARLPLLLREKHQLLIVCAVGETRRAELDALARAQGLKPNEVIFSGFVDHDELIQLYNLCALFVFPSLHEGFGLPVLEAMACGAPTIGSNNSSIPEVIDFEPALFDARDVNSIKDKIEHALKDAEFSRDISARGLKRSAFFSWDRSAVVALAAMETLRAA